MIWILCFVHMCWYCFNLLQLLLGHPLQLVHVNAAKSPFLAHGETIQEDWRKDSLKILKYFLVLSCLMVQLGQREYEAANVLHNNVQLLAGCGVQSSQ